jgi:hypothetical protein
MDESNDGGEVESLLGISLSSVHSLTSAAVGSGGGAGDVGVTVVGTGAGAGTGNSAKHSSSGGAKKSKARSTQATSGGASKYWLPSLLPLPLFGSPLIASLGAI